MRSRQIFDSVIDYAIIATISTGVTRWNVGAGRVFGWREEEMAGQPADRIFTPKDRASGWAKSRCAGAGGPQS